MAKNKKTRTLVMQEIVDDFRSNLIKGNLKPGDKLLEGIKEKNFDKAKEAIRGSLEDWAQHGL